MKSPGNLFQCWITFRIEIYLILLKWDFYVFQSIAHCFLTYSLMLSSYVRCFKPFISFTVLVPLCPCLPCSGEAETAGKMRMIDSLTCW